MVERNPGGGKALFYLPHSLPWNPVPLDRLYGSHFLFQMSFLSFPPLLFLTGQSDPGLPTFKHSLHCRKKKNLNADIIMMMMMMMVMQTWPQHVPFYIPSIVFYYLWWNSPSSPHSTSSQSPFFHISSHTLPSCFILHPPLMSLWTVCSSTHISYFFTPPCH